MIKRILSVMLASVYFIIPVYAEETPEVVIPQQQEASNEPIIHEEIIPADIEIPDSEDYELKFAATENNGSALFALQEITDYSVWDSIFSQGYGEDFFSPSMKSKDEINIGGRNNNLTITNEDLYLPGRNGLDISIRRIYDNQYDNRSYAAAYDTGLINHTNSLYTFEVKNPVTNKIYKIGVYSKDYYYIYLRGRNYLTIDPDSISQKTNTDNNGHSVTYIPFDYFKYYLTDDENNAVAYVDDCGETSSRHVEIQRDTGLWLFGAKLFSENGNLGCGFRLNFPEVYLEQVYSKSYGGGEHDREYYGSFRNLSNTVVGIDGDISIRKRSSGEKVYTSQYSAVCNNKLKCEAFFAIQNVPGTDREYNFKICDEKGHTYYFLSDTELQRVCQNLYPVAITDEYGNSILYDFDENEKIRKITDSYGREVNFSYTENLIQITYSENNEIKTISYQTETLPTSTIVNDSCLDGKEVIKFTYTNANGEETEYFLREAQAPVYTEGIYRRVPNMLEEYQFGDYHLIELPTTYNMEKVVYPSGMEREFKYKLYYIPRINTGVFKGSYTVKENFECYGTEIRNRQTYSVSGGDEINLSISDNKGLLSNKTYDSYGKLTFESEKSQSRFLYKTYAYDNSVDVTCINTHEDMHSTSVNYVYALYYPGLPTKVYDEKSQIAYTYHIVDEKWTDKVQTATYQEKKNGYFVTDYIVTTGLTEDNKSIAWEETTKDGVVISRNDYTYNEYGEISSVTTKISDTESIVKNYTYTHNSDNTITVTITTPGIKDADGITLPDISESYILDIYGNPISAIDGRGNITTLEYDDAGRITERTYPNGATEEIEYNLENRTVVLTLASGGKIKYSYDGFENLIKTERIYNAQNDVLSEYEYDEYNRIAEKLIYLSEDSGKKEEYTYDAFNRVLTEKISDSELNQHMYTNTYTYLKPTNLTQKHIVIKNKTGADGATLPQEKNYYDYYFRNTKREVISGNTTLTESFSYDYKDRLIQKTDFKGNTESYTYDSFDNLLVTTRADQSSFSNTYDMAGRKITATDALGNTESYTYDNRSRLIKTVTPLDNRNSEIKYYYDNSDNRTAVKTKTDTGWKTEEYTYDVMSKVASATSGTGEETSVVKYAYDLSGNLISLTTGLSSPTSTNGKETSYEYSPFGELLKETDPMGYEKSYVYDFSGNPLNITDKNGNNITYTYDIFGVKTVTADGVSDTVTRDNFGREISRNTENISYDNFGRISQIIDGDISKIYGYDNNSNVISFILKEGTEEKQNISYTYDNLNRVIAMTDNGIQSNFSYNPNGNLISKTVNGITTGYEYNKAGLVTKITGINVYECDYTLDGLKTFESKGNSIKNYTYDSQGRISSVTGVYPESYTYDDSGNIQTKTTLDGITSYVYDDNNRLVTETKRTDNTVVEQTSCYYDYNGNLMSQNILTNSAGAFSATTTVPEGIKLYEYDGLNRLISYEASGIAAEYTYGFDGLRKTKTVNNITTSYTWNGQNLSYEKTGTEENVYGYDVTGVISANMNGTQYFFEKDTHGSISGILNSNGNLLETNDYTAFGIKINTDNISIPFGYSGEYLDSETGYIYLRNRYYDTTTGRFITEDPARDGLNWYVYCGDNPVNLIDPSGLKITLTGTEDEMQRSFNQLQQLTNDELAYDKETGVVSIVSSGTMNIDTTLTAGTKMINDLILNMDFNVSLERIYVEDEGCYYKNDTNRGIIIQMNDWDEKGGNWGYMVSDGKGGSLWEDHANVAHIVLGHELIHATHYMNGTVADSTRTVYRYTDFGLVTDVRNNLNVSEEYNTVGLYHVVEYQINDTGNALRRFYTPGPKTLTENTLRAEQGLSKRIAY